MFMQTKRVRFWGIVLLCLAVLLSGLNLTSVHAASTDVSASAYIPNPTLVTGDFTIVVLPDTQNYSQFYPSTFADQTQWIVDNAAALKIAYVAHVGDIVNNGNNLAQWANASNAMNKLEAAHIPYGVTLGNHDYDAESSTPGAGQNSGTTYFNNFKNANNVYVNPNYNFGVGRFKTNYPNNYGNYYPYVLPTSNPTPDPTADNGNNFVFFSAGGLNYIVLNLAYDARYESSRYTGPLIGTRPNTNEDPVINWADSVLKAYPTHRAFVVTHYVLNTAGALGDQGTAIDKVLRKNPNFFMMLSGHMGGSDAAPGESQKLLGNNVNALLSDYQWSKGQNSGYLRIMTFSPSRNKIYVRTFSPHIDKDGGVGERTETTSRFELSGFLNCEINLVANTHTCGGLPWVSMVQSPSGGQVVVKISGQASTTFQVTYGTAPTGWTVNIGDSATNNGYGGDSSTQSRDAEMQVVGANMAIYGNDYNSPPGALLKTVTSIANTSYPLNLRVKDQYLYWQMYVVNGIFTSPYLYALTGQPDAEAGGIANYDIYAAFNRTILYDSTRTGTGVSTVKISFP